MSKSRRKQKIVTVWVVGIFSLLGSLYIFLDVILESALEEVAEDNGIEIISLKLDHLQADRVLAEQVSAKWKVQNFLDIGIKVEEISKPQWWDYLMPNDLFRATVKGFEMVAEAGQVDISQAQFVYFWKKLNLFLNAVSIDGLSIQLDGQKLRDLSEEMSAMEEEGNRSRTPGFSPFKYLKTPPVSHVRFRNSNIKFSDLDDVFRLDFNSTSLLTEGFMNFHLDGVLLGLPMKSDLTYTLEEDILHMTSKLEFMDLANADLALRRINVLETPGSAYLKVNSGNLTFRQNAMIDSNQSDFPRQVIESLFIEANASKLGLLMGENSLQVSKFIAFLNDFSEGIPKSINAYANLNWNNQVEMVGARFQARQLEANNSEPGVTAMSAEIWELNGSRDFPFKAKNLAIPFFEVEHDSKLENILSDQHEVRFDQFSWGDGQIKLEKGQMFFRKQEQFDKWDLEMPPVMLHLPDQQLTFSNFSYQGTLDFQLLPEIHDFQEIRIPSLQVGDDFMMKDIFLAFRVPSKHEIELKSLEFSVGEMTLKIDPARITLKSLQEPHADGNYSIDFNQSRLVVANKDYELEILGLHGSIKIISLDPFSTGKEQVLSFEQANIGDFSFTEGNLSMDVIDGIRCQIHKLSMSGFDGRVGLKESLISLEQLDSRIVLVLEQVCGQSLVDLFKDLDLKIDGNFSGQIPLAPDRENVWDFVGGFLKFIDEGRGYYSWDAKGLLSSTLDESDLLYQQTVLAEAALQNLSMNSMRLDFKIVDGEREVQGLIQGNAEVEGKKIDLDYKPRVSGDLREILEAIDLIKFQVNQ
jgi:hypothetical protein